MFSILGDRSLMAILMLKLLSKLASLPEQLSTSVQRSYNPDIFKTVFRLLRSIVRMKTWNSYPRGRSYCPRFKHLVRACKKARVNRLIWPGNSHDFNLIKPCWPFIKRHTTKNGASARRPEANRAWFQACDELEQWRIQGWIERIPRHIQEASLSRDNQARGRQQLQGRSRRSSKDKETR
jgi:hypothetical protein